MATRDSHGFNLVVILSLVWKSLHGEGCEKHEVRHLYHRKPSFLRGEQNKRHVIRYPHKGLENQCVRGTI